MQIFGKDNSGFTEGFTYSPLIAFDNLQNTALPLYDFEENMQADNTTFTENLSFIAKNHKKEHAWFIFLLTFGIIFIILGLVAICLVKIAGGGAEKMNRESLIASMVAMEEKEL